MLIFFNHNNNTSKSELSVICKVRSTCPAIRIANTCPPFPQFFVSVFQYLFSLSALLYWTEVFCSEVNKQQAVLIFSKSLIIVSALPGQSTNRQCRENNKRVLTLKPKKPFSHHAFRFGNRHLIVAKVSGKRWFLCKLKSSEKRSEAVL